MANTHVAELQQLIDGGGSPSDEDLKLPLSQLALQVNSILQSGAGASAPIISSAVLALKAVPGTGNTEVRVNCLLDAAYYFYVVGQTFNAIEPAQLAADLAAQSRHAHLTRKATTLLGAIYADTGNISGAIECYARALELVHQLNDIDGECIVLINLGVALHYAAQYHEALTCFEKVLQLGEVNPDVRKHRTAALSNIALCSLHLEDFARGLKAAEMCVKESEEPHSAGELVARVLRENNYIRLLLEVNSVERARERCEIARKYVARSKSARAEMAASIAEGLYEVHAGKVDVGISRLMATLEKARMMRSMLRDTLAALVKAYEIMGQPQRALIYLREMMEAIRQTQQENALRHLKLHLATTERALEGSAPLEKRLMRQEAALKGKVAEQELFRSRIEMLERLAVTAELRDDSTGEHSYRVGKLAALLAQEFGCDDDTCYMIELAARLHDIGKIGVPDAILLKPDKLNEAETNIMRTHTTVGAELLSRSNIPHMQMAEEIARHHHEWWGGTGYPGNLSGNAIPLAARITALADVFDALTHKRPYKVAWPVQAALDEIAQLKGTQFDPQLTDLFIVLISRLRSDYSDLDSFLGTAAQDSPFLQARARIWHALHRGGQDDSGAGSRLDLQR